MNRPTSDGFVARLEALRGIAALAVALFHAFIWIAFGEQRALFTKPVMDVHGLQATSARMIIAIFCGPAAVNVFFVLSGFVLARSLRKTSPGIAMYARYIVKRGFRIFPALIVSIGLALLYRAMLYPGYEVFPIASTWFNWWYKDPITFQEAASNVLMLSASLNSNAWTLRIEMLASLILPFVVGILGKSGWLRTALLLIASLIWAVVTNNQETAPGELAHYAYMFVLGAALEKHIGQIPRVPLPFAAALWLLSIGTVIFVNAYWQLAHFLSTDAAIAVCATIWIWLIVADSESRYLACLDSRVVRYLGRLSYSFYILHFVFLYAIANWTLRGVPEHVLARYPIVAAGAVGLISIVVTLPAASLSYRFVEKPMIETGKRLASLRGKLRTA